MSGFVGKEGLKIRFGRPRDPKSFHSEANLLTYARLVLCLTFFILALVEKRELYNYIGIVIHWVADVADGYVARKLKQETIYGAEIDIISDRIETTFFCVNFMFFHPALFIPIAVFLLDFAFVDFYLTNQFTKFSLISPNHFYKVDRTVFALNFGRTGKAVNSVAVVALLAFFPSLWVVATALAAGLIGVKIYSIWRLYRKRESPVPLETEDMEEERLSCV
ncbi:MAG: CDP-alcohol phosphatidyltransferase family protein [bacterium]